MAEKILLVEDEEYVRDVLTRMLRASKYEVVCASRPFEALEVMRQFPGDIVLLLTDLVMPEMNGWKLYCEIRKENPHLEVVFMSAYSSDNPVVEKILANGLTFLSKPFSMKLLSATLESKLSRMPGQEMEI